MNTINNILNKFTWILIGILAIILVYTSIEFIALVIRTILNRTGAFDLTQPKVNTEELFLVHVQGLIAGVLLITIIIELIHTLITSLDKNKKNNYLIVLFEIATIAVIRHLFIYELDHMNGLNIIGIAFLLLVLGSFNLLFRNERIQRIMSSKITKTDK